MHTAIAKEKDKEYVVFSTYHNLKVITNHKRK